MKKMEKMMEKKLPGSYNVDTTKRLLDERPDLCPPGEDVVVVPCVPKNNLHQWFRSAGWREVGALPYNLNRTNVLHLIFAQKRPEPVAIEESIPLKMETPLWKWLLPILVGALTSGMLAFIVGHYWLR